MDYGLRILLGGGALFLIPPILLLGLIIISIFKIFFSQDSKRTYQNSPLDKLNERYAKGELDDHDYKKMKQNILK